MTILQLLNVLIHHTPQLFCLEKFEIELFYGQVGYIEEL